MKSWAPVGDTEAATALLLLTAAEPAPLAADFRSPSWSTSVNVAQGIRMMTMMTTMMKMRTLFTWARMAQCTGSSDTDSWERTTRTSWSTTMKATRSGERDAFHLIRFLLQFFPSSFLPQCCLSPPSPEGQSHLSFTEWAWPNETWDAVHNELCFYNCIHTMKCVAFKNSKRYLTLPNFLFLKIKLTKLSFIRRTRFVARWFLRIFNISSWQFSCCDGFIDHITMYNCVGLGFKIWLIALFMFVFLFYPCAYCCWY